MSTMHSIAYGGKAQIEELSTLLRLTVTEVARRLGAESSGCADASIALVGADNVGQARMANTPTARQTPSKAA